VPNYSSAAPRNGSASHEQAWVAAPSAAPAPGGRSWTSASLPANYPPPREHPRSIAKTTARPRAAPGGGAALNPSVCDYVQRR